MANNKIELKNFNLALTITAYLLDYKNWKEYINLPEIPFSWVVENDKEIKLFDNILKKLNKKQIK